MYHVSINKISDIRIKWFKISLDYKEIRENIDEQLYFFQRKMFKFFLSFFISFKLRSQTTRWRLPWKRTFYKSNWRSIDKRDTYFTSAETSARCHPFIFTHTESDPGSYPITAGIGHHWPSSFDRILSLFFTLPLYLSLAGHSAAIRVDLLEAVWEWKGERVRVRNGIRKRERCTAREGTLY